MWLCLPEMYTKRLKLVRERKELSSRKSPLNLLSMAWNDIVNVVSFALFLKNVASTDGYCNHVALGRISSKVSRLLKDPNTVEFLFP